jgi:type II secretory pathway pseudopilin PulG
MSVIEVTVVVLMLSVLTAIAVPNVVLARNAYRLRIAADAVRQQLYLCRQRALVANQTCSIQITTAGRAQIDTNFNGTFGDWGGNGVPADEPGTTLDLSGISLTSADTPIVRRFSSRGEVPWQESPQDLSITVAYAGRQRIITIEQRGSISVGDETAATTP